jgi:hypothetical protein
MVVVKENSALRIQWSLQFPTQIMKITCQRRSEGDDRLLYGWLDKKSRSVFLEKSGQVAPLLSSNTKPLYVSLSLSGFIWTAQRNLLQRLSESQ